jgi:hypothetical protein
MYRTTRTKLFVAGRTEVGYYDDRYASVLQDIARGKAQIVLPDTFPGQPRYEYLSIVVNLKKGGLLRQGGPDLADEFRLTTTLAAGWAIVDVYAGADFWTYHLQRRHESDCTCKECEEWRDFIVRLQPH